jgi:hypothetical protein
MFRVVDAAGNGVTGLVIGDFTVTTWNRGYASSDFSAWTHGTTLTAKGFGWYRLDAAGPPSAGIFLYRIKANSTSYQHESPNEWNGEVEVQDLDSLYGATVRPVAQLTQSAQLGMALPMEFVAYRYRELAITVVDQDGEEITSLETDFPASGLRVAIRSQDQTTTKWEAGPSGTISIPSSGGGTAADFAVSISGAILTIVMPEDASWFAALATGTSSINTLFIEVTGNRDGDADKTQPIIRSSQITLARREVGLPA